MTARPQTLIEQDRRPVGDSRRHNRLAITAACFGVLSLLLTVSSLKYRPGPAVGTDYAAGRFGTPLPFATVALACGIPAMLRTLRPAGQDGPSWDGREPATVSLATAGLAAAIAVVRIVLLIASR